MNSSLRNDTSHLGLQPAISPWGTNEVKYQGLVPANLLYGGRVRARSFLVGASRLVSERLSAAKEPYPTQGRDRK